MSCAHARGQASRWPMRGQLPRPNPSDTGFRYIFCICKDYLFLRSSETGMQIFGPGCHQGTATSSPRWWRLPQMTSNPCCKAFVAHRTKQPPGQPHHDGAGRWPVTIHRAHEEVHETCLSASQRPRSTNIPSQKLTWNLNLGGSQAPAVWLPAEAHWPHIPP